MHVLSGPQKLKRLYLGLMVFIREGKVSRPPLSVSSKSLVLGTLVLHHGRKSLSSVASKLHLQPEQEDAFMKELPTGRSYQE